MQDALTSSLVEAAGSRSRLLAINQVVHLAPSTDQARREAAAALYPLNRAVHNLLPKSGDREPVLRNGIASEILLPQEPSEDDLLANAIIGDPDTAIEQLRRYADCGVGHLSLHFNIGQPHELVVRSMRLFAQVVRPALRGATPKTAACAANNPRADRR
jgi:alkanesulfonate monooxygenase SsuD/methylene tetrahydromethanopterin reductase-like flavin-dependent oxidoreductase (luciferase family)